MNDDSIRKPRKNPSASTNITLPVISVEKFRRSGLFVAFSQTHIKCMYRMIKSKLKINKVNHYT